LRPCAGDLPGSDARPLGVLSWPEQAHTLVIAHTMGVVTFSLYTLFFSIATKDEWRSPFSLDTFSDKTFVIGTGVSVLTLRKYSEVV
jgi:P-type Ca2+ transporter type 2C